MLLFLFYHFPFLIALSLSVLFPYQVETAVGQQKADSFHTKFLEVSAKDNLNIDMVFFLSFFLSFLIFPLSVCAAL
jgi:hypothetical protein